MDKGTKKRIEQKVIEELQKGKRMPIDGDEDEEGNEEEFGEITDTQEQFKEDMQTAGYKVRTYRGRYFYRGYAAEVPHSELQRAIRATEIELQWDELGLDLIVHPRG